MVVVVVVVVTAETRTESTPAVVSARPEVVREQPLVVEATITWNIHGCLLHEGVTLDSGALLSTTSILIDKTISKVAVSVTVIIVHYVTIGVGLLQGGGLLVEVVLQVRVLEGEREGAAVGGPRRQLEAVGADREHRDSGPRLRDGVTRADSVLGPRREAWR